MMDANFLDRLYKEAETQIFGKESIGEFSTKPLYLIEGPSPVAIKTHTLKSIIDYIKIDNMPKLVHVVSPTHVTVISTLNNIQQRHKYLYVEYNLEGLLFKSFIQVDQFIIDLQASFIQTEARDKILMIVGNLRAEDVKENHDDGISQEVVVKKTAASVASVEVPNPVTLIPFRSFPEIEQPASQFVFRLNYTEHSGFSCGLWPADGDGWKLGAIERIKEWLIENGCDENIILA